MRLELTQANAHHPLKVACIPISPPEQIHFILKKRPPSLSLSEKRDSNPRPRPWQGRALPTELFSHYLFFLSIRNHNFVAKRIFSQSSGMLRLRGQKYAKF